MALITPSMRQMQLSKAHALTATVGGVNCFELDFGARSNPVCVCVSLPPICLQINLSEKERRERERETARKKKESENTRARTHAISCLIQSSRRLQLETFTLHWHSIFFRLHRRHNSIIFTNCIQNIMILILWFRHKQQTNIVRVENTKKCWHGARFHSLGQHGCGSVSLVQNVIFSQNDENRYFRIMAHFGFVLAHFGFRLI